MIDVGLLKEEVMKLITPTQKKKKLNLSYYALSERVSSQTSSGTEVRFQMYCSNTKFENNTIPNFFQSNLQVNIRPRTPVIF